jgi:WD40 repeat protein
LDKVWSLAGWKGILMSGSEKKTIGVWDVGTGEQTTTLTGHDGAVYALAVHEDSDRLFSSSHGSVGLGDVGCAADGLMRTGAVSSMPCGERVASHQRIIR